MESPAYRTAHNFHGLIAQVSLLPKDWPDVSGVFKNPLNWQTWKYEQEKVISWEGGDSYHKELYAGTKPKKCKIFGSVKKLGEWVIFLQKKRVLQLLIQVIYSQQNPLSIFLL